jgi:hypothetical protein
MENKQAYKSWFTRIREVAINKGVSIKGAIHKAVPVQVDGKWLKGICLKCSSNNGFVFESTVDKSTRIVFCQRCNKYSWVIPGNQLVETKKPETLKEHIQKVEVLESKRCIALTTKGVRCSKDSKTPEGLCSYHKTGKLIGKEVKIIPDNVF